MRRRSFIFRSLAAIASLLGIKLEASAGRREKPIGSYTVPDPGVWVSMKGETAYLAPGEYKVFYDPESGMSLTAININLPKTV